MTKTVWSNSDHAPVCNFLREGGPFGSLILHPMQGMIAAAHAVQIKLESERVLEKAFMENKVIHTRICICVLLYLSMLHIMYM